MTINEASINEISQVSNLRPTTTVWHCSRQTDPRRYEIATFIVRKKKERREISARSNHQKKQKIDQELIHLERHDFHWSHLLGAWLTNQQCVNLASGHVVVIPPSASVLKPRMSSLHTLWNFSDTSMVL